MTIMTALFSGGIMSVRVPALTLNGAELAQPEMKRKAIRAGMFGTAAWAKVENVKMTLVMWYIHKRPKTSDIGPQTLQTYS